MDENKQVTLLDFWAAWCGPCKIMNPIIEEIEHEYSGKIKVVKINVDEPTSQKMVEQYQIGAMPTYIIEQNGQVVSSFVGSQSKKTITGALDQALG